MDVAIVAPCPVPYMIGGAENLCRGLQDHLNESTEHQAEILKLPSREFSFLELVDSYRAFAWLDLTGFDLVVSMKYPAWMVEHPRHVVYMLHTLRGLYDAYPSFGLPMEVPDPPAPVRDLLAFLDATAGERGSLEECFARLDSLRKDPSLRPDLFAFPGPLIRRVVMHLDAIGLAPGPGQRYGAISRAVIEREAYFPPSTAPFVAHPPTELRTREGGQGDYVFTASRLDGPKRIDLLVAAMAHADPKVRLIIAGTGPEESRLRELVAGDPRIELRGRVSNAELVDLYAESLAVAFVPAAEDYGMVALEGMQSGKPIVTCVDSGGPTELVTHGESGLVVAPDPAAIGAAFTELRAGRRRATKAMGRAARERARAITWDAVVAELLVEA